MPLYEPMQRRPSTTKPTILPPVSLPLTPRVENHQVIPSISLTRKRARSISRPSCRSPAATRKLKSKPFIPPTLTCQRELFTRTSNFPTTTLPPLGCRACNLDGQDETDFDLNQNVFVRRFRKDTRDWSPWESGMVIAKGRTSGPIGVHARWYRVRLAGSSLENPLEEKYFHFLGEIRDRCSPPPDLTAQECLRRSQQASLVYARLKSNALGITNPQWPHVWVPATLLEYNETSKPGIYKIVVLNTINQKRYAVTNILPYTWETAMACRHSGAPVMRAEDGKIERPLERGTMTL